MKSEESKLPRGLRNNNPLNIRLSSDKWQGQRPPLLGATGVFREATECGFGPTKGSESPFTTEFGLGVRPLGVRLQPKLKNRRGFRTGNLGDYLYSHLREKGMSCLLLVQIQVSLYSTSYGATYHGVVTNTQEAHHLYVSRY